MSRYNNFSAEMTGAIDAMQRLDDIPARILRNQKWALGTLQRRMRTEANSEIRAEYKVPKGRAKKDLIIRSIPDGVSILGKARGINAIEFGATWSRNRAGGVLAVLSRSRGLKLRVGAKMRGDTSVGAKYSARRGDRPRAHEGSFIARGKNGALLVLKRLPGQTYVSESGYSKGKTVEKLTGLYGPMLAEMLKHGRRPERLVDFAIRTLQSEQARLFGSNP